MCRTVVRTFVVVLDDGPHAGRRMQVTSDYGVPHAVMSVDDEFYTRRAVPAGVEDPSEWRYRWIGR